MKKAKVVNVVESFVGDQLHKLFDFLFAASIFLKRKTFVSSSALYHEKKAPCNDFLKTHYGKKISSY